MLDSSGFSRNMCTIIQQIREAESFFRLAGAGVENYEKTLRAQNGDGSGCQVEWTAFITDSAFPNVLLHGIVVAAIRLTIGSGESFLH